MFPFPTLYLKLAAAAILAAIIGWHFIGDSRTKSALESARAEVMVLQVQKKSLEDELVKATQDAKALGEQISAAETQRKQVQVELQVTLKKLRAQKPPVECKAAIDWAVENKGDLAW